MIDAHVINKYQELSWSHIRTVVRECCNGDNERQWKSPKFDPSLHQTSLNRFSPKLACVITSWRAPDMQNQPGISVPQICDFNVLQGWLCSFFGSWNSLQPKPLNGFYAKYVKRRRSSEGCAFWRSWWLNRIFRPPFCWKPPFWGLILTGGFCDQKHL